MSDDLSARLGCIEDVEQHRTSRPDAPAYSLGGQEIVRFQSKSTVDIRLTRAGIRERRALLSEDDRIQLRSSNGDDWVTVEIREPADEDLVVELAKAAAQAQRSSP